VVVLLECRGIDSTDRARRRSSSTRRRAGPQTSGERYQDSFNTAFPPWRVDRYASATQRQDIVGAPPSRPPACGAQPRGVLGAVPGRHHHVLRRQRWLRRDGSRGGQRRCALALPSNTTYGVTEPDGTGSVELRRVDRRGQRLARLLGHGRLLARRRPDHGHQLRRGRGLAPRRAGRACRRRRRAGAAAPGSTSPGRSSRPSAARTPRSAGALWWAAVQLAQPHHGAAPASRRSPTCATWSRPRPASTSTAPSC
jgi:hypothetical protein